MTREPTTDPDGWRRVYAFVKRRQHDLGWTWVQVVNATVSKTTLQNMKDHGTGLTEEATRRRLCEGIGWRNDSIALILAGGEPVVISDFKRSTGAELTVAEMADQIAALRREVEDLKREQRGEGPLPLPED